MVLLDTWPILYGVRCAHRLGLFNKDQRRASNNGDGDGVVLSGYRVTFEAVEEVCLTMRFWSPACRINHLLMIILDGCLFTHVSILFMLTMGITKLHTTIFRNLYCTVAF